MGGVYSVATEIQKDENLNHKEKTQFKVNLCKMREWVLRLSLFPRGLCHQLYSATWMLHDGLGTHCTGFFQLRMQGDVDSM